MLMKVLGLIEFEDNYSRIELIFYTFFRIINYISSLRVTNYSHDKSQEIVFVLCLHPGSRESFIHFPRKR